MASQAKQPMRCLRPSAGRLTGNERAPAALRAGLSLCSARFPAVWPRSGPVLEGLVPQSSCSGQGLGRVASECQSRRSIVSGGLGSHDSRIEAGVQPASWQPGGSGSSTEWHARGFCSVEKREKGRRTGPFLTHHDVLRCDQTCARDSDRAAIALRRRSSLYLSMRLRMSPRFSDERRSTKRTPSR